MLIQGHGHDLVKCQRNISETREINSNKVVLQDGAVYDIHSSYCLKSSASAGRLWVRWKGGRCADGRVNVIGVGGGVKVSELRAVRVNTTTEIDITFWRAPSHI